jgi:HEAT repeat protein
MSKFRRCLLAFITVAAPLLVLALFHPYPRQWLFGPTIRGKPQCVWEATVRRQFGERSDSWFEDFRHWLDGAPGQPIRLDHLFDHPEMAPVVVALLDDDDPGVRSVCMAALIEFPSVRDRSALPALRKRHQDDEVQLQMMAGIAIYRIEQDAEMLRWFVMLLNHADPQIRVLAMSHLGRLSEYAPEAYPEIVARAKDPDKAMRCNVMNALAYFGEKGVPTLIDGLSDADAGVRYHAVLIAERLGPDARKAMPALEACLRDPDPGVRHAVHSALPSIDPKRFTELQRSMR